MPDSRALKDMMMKGKMMGKKMMDDVMDTGKKVAEAYKKGKQDERDMFGKKPKQMPKR